MSLVSPFELAPDMRFSIDREAIATKVIDGEAIIINLATGLYYSTDGVGAVVWELLAAGQSAAEILTVLDKTFAVDRGRMGSDIASFISSLLAEGLVSHDDDVGEAISIAVDGENLAKEYAAPQLDRYDDLAHFFALDPPLPQVE